MATYIQHKEGIPFGVDAAIAMYGFMSHDSKIIPFTHSDIENDVIKPWVIQKNVFVGVTDTMRLLFEKQGKTPQSITFPAERKDFKFGTLGEVRKIFNETKEPIFVKSIKIKEFDGKIIRDIIDFNFMSRFSDDIEVGYSPVYSIDAEYRIYVQNGKIEAMINYSGLIETLLSPADLTYIQKQIDLNKKTFPCCYTMDIGLSENSLLLIEYNDFWAIGNYGLDPYVYATMLKNRYFEIING